MVEGKTHSQTFDFSGNWLCLDFVNTVHDRASNPRELLNSYTDLIIWSQESQLMTEQETQQLLVEAARCPADADIIYQQALVLRETIYHIFRALAEEFLPAQADLDILNTQLSKAMAQAHIVLQAGGFAWDWIGKEDVLDRILWAVARSAADLLTSAHLSEVRVCAAEDCGWLFLDTSKNHSRRWCDMNSCGNRAKVRKHYERKKQSPSSSSISEIGMER